MAKTRFYNPRFLMSMKDKNGETPELFFTLGNRGSGKTFNITLEILVRDYILKDRKVGVLTRVKDDLGKVAEGIFKEVLHLYYPDTYVEEVNRGKYSDIYFVSGEGENRVRKHVGYVLPINRSYQLKPISSTFADCDIMFMDEFQVDGIESNKNIVSDFISLHQTVARGNGQAVRYVPVILASNFINILNPFFVALGLHRMPPDCRKFRGDGVVVEMFLNEDVQKLQEQSPFNRAFAGHKQLVSSNNNEWLIGNNSLISKPTEEWGFSHYVCTLTDGSKKFGVRRYPNCGIYYVNRSIDETCQYNYNISLDGDLNLPMLKKATMMKVLREAFAGGMVRVSDAECKEIMLSLFV